MRAFFLTILTVACSLVQAQATRSASAPAPAHEASAKLLMPDQKMARGIVESVYNTWRVAVQRGDESAWRRSTSNSRQMRVRNLVISERGVFPRDFFKSAQSAPQLENFHYVGTVGGCGGKTLAATYIGKMQLGDASPKENAFVLLFVSEDGRWKLDQTRFFDLSRIPEVLKRLQAQDLTVLKEQDGFHPYSSLPPVPQACRAPELVGKIFVDCPGRVVDMRINGVSVHDFDNERRADTISGGLKRGANTISYTIRNSSASPDRPRMGIGIFVMPEAQGNQPVCVFDHVLDAGDEAKGGSFTFNISPEHLAAMNPKRQGPPAQPFHAVPLKSRPAATQPKP